MTTSRNETRRAQVVGTGLIGASVGLALRGAGWFVTGSDNDPERQRAALERRALDAVGLDIDAEIAFVATPLASVEPVVSSLLGGAGARSRLVVTDVAGVKGPLAAAIGDPRFVGGHPMAGSEQSGVEGADASLFVGATWVLTPTEHTDPESFARVRSVVASFGAEVMALSAEEHDALVAVVSHVPHLTAAALMNLAERTSDEHAALLRLAAGGFRDMTRVAAGHPGIWPDVCVENSSAIVATLDSLIKEIGDLRERVSSQDREGLLEVLGSAAAARRSLPIGAGAPDELVEVRVPVPDKPGVIAEVTTLAGDLGVNIFDLEIAHSAEGDKGVMLLVVNSKDAQRLSRALGERDYTCTLGQIG